jgi:hypothetical protein
MLAITDTKIMKIKVAEWGTPKKIFKKMPKQTTLEITIKKALVELTFLTLQLYCLNEVRQF